MVRWRFEKVERLAGLVSDIVAFLDSRKGRQARWRMMGQLSVQPGVPAGVRFMRKSVRQGLVHILGACDKLEFGGMVRCARGVHAGMGFCAADARESVECDVTCWGFWVGHWYAAGGWQAVVRRALKNSRLSITPLECVVALFAVRIWLEHWEGIRMPERERGELGQ